MGRQSASTAELKRQLIAELHAARLDLGVETQLARQELNPTALVKQSFAKYKWAWIAGGAAAGLLFIRLLLPPKHFRSDKSGDSDKTRGLTGLLRGWMTSLVKKAAISYATRNLKDHLQDYLQSLLKRQAPDSSTSSHV